MLKLSPLRLRFCPVLLTCVVLTVNSNAATGVGVASATVLPSTLSASIALYVNTAPSLVRSSGSSFYDMANAPAGFWPPEFKPTAVTMDQDGIAQFTMFDNTATNYVVRLSDSAYSVWPNGANMPVVLEPALTPGGRLSIVVALAPSGTFANAFQVFLNYN